MHNRFAVVLPWVEDRNAETEFVQRCRRAAINAGVECVLVDRYGHDRESGQKVRGSELDFVIATHFTVPKVLDCFSFFILNNPIQYYFDWDYRVYSERALTHDDFLRVGSQSTDDLMRRSLHRDPLHLPPEFFLYSAQPGPVMAPRVMQRRLLLVTTHWDKERHRDLLPELDRRDLLDLYGSTSFDWPEYRNYKGELPFDGRAVIERIAETGAVLALSSAAHIREEVMTSRLYEGLAAGAVVVCDQNPFGREHFGDTLLYVDTARPDAAEQIAAHVDWMNANPEQAAEMAREAQKIFEERFSADVCLKTIYDRLDERKKALQFGLDPADSTNPLVRVLYLLTDPSEQGWLRLRDFCLGQDYRRMQLQLLLEPGQQVDKTLTAVLKERGVLLKVQRVENLTERSATEVGSVLAEGIREALQDEDFEYLCVLTSAEQPFSNHLSSLLRLFRARPDCTVATTTEVFEKAGPYNEFEYTQRLWTQASVDFAADLNANPIGFARFLLSRQALDQCPFSLLRWLNRKAMAALVVGRPLAESGLATVLVDADAPFFLQQTDAGREDPLIRQLYPDFAPAERLEIDEMRRQMGGLSAQQQQELQQQQQQQEQLRGQLQSLAASLEVRRYKRRRRRRRLQRGARIIALAVVLAAVLWWLVG